MSVSTDNDDTRYRTVGTEATELQRYADVSLEDGEVIIYDRDNEAAWIQSPSAIGLEFMA
jgi:hypothetical protein